ncbi:MAG: hypothetical protein WCO55_01665 [Candidatus Falkowbacteria bacterium]
MICEIITGYFTSKSEKVALQEEVNIFRLSLLETNCEDNIKTTWLQSVTDHNKILTAIVEYPNAVPSITEKKLAEVSTKMKKGK